MLAFKIADIITIEIGSQLFLASPVLTFYLDKIIRRHAVAFKSCLGGFLRRVRVVLKSQTLLALQILDCPIS